MLDAGVDGIEHDPCYTGKKHWRRESMIT